MNMAAKNSRQAGGHTLIMILAALFAAITGVLSWVSVPLPFTPVPINLALLGVLVSGNVLGAMGRKNAGAMSMLLYIALGAIGIPVFSGGSAGVGVLAGPTGGFIAGYVFAALFEGYFGWKRQSKLIQGSLYNYIATVLCYIPGVVWFVISTGSTVSAGLAACILPFMPGDIFKSVAAAFISGRLIKATHKNF